MSIKNLNSRTTVVPMWCQSWQIPRYNFRKSQIRDSYEWMSITFCCSHGNTYVGDSIPFSLKECMGENTNVNFQFSVQSHSYHGHVISNNFILIIGTNTTVNLLSRSLVYLARGTHSGVALVPWELGSA